MFGRQGRICTEETLPMRGFFGESELKAVRKGNWRRRNKIGSIGAAKKKRLGKSKSSESDRFRPG